MRKLSWIDRLPYVILAALCLVSILSRLFLISR
jgi:hypothetical protein